MSQSTPQSHSASLSTYASSFVVSVAVLLAATALAKVYSTLGTAKVLELQDGLLNISNRRLFQFAAIFETVILILLSLNGSTKIRLLLIAWASTLLLAYRLGVYVVVGHFHECPCLGTLTELIPISPRLLNYVMILALLYMLIGSIGLLALLKRASRSNDL